MWIWTCGHYLYTLWPVPAPAKCPTAPAPHAKNNSQYPCHRTKNTDPPFGKHPRNQRSAPMSNSLRRPGRLLISSTQTQPRPSPRHSRHNCSRIPVMQSAPCRVELVRCSLQSMARRKKCPSPGMNGVVNSSSRKSSWLDRSIRIRVRRIRGFNWVVATVSCRYLPLSFFVVLYSIFLLCLIWSLGIQLGWFYDLTTYLSLGLWKAFWTFPHISLLFCLFPYLASHLVFFESVFGILGIGFFG